MIQWISTVFAIRSYFTNKYKTDSYELNFGIQNYEENLEAIRFKMGEIFSKYLDPECKEQDPENPILFFGKKSLYQILDIIGYEVHEAFNRIVIARIHIMSGYVIEDRYWRVTYSDD